MISNREILKKAEQYSLKQADIARLLGFSPSIINRIWKGGKPSPAQSAAIHFLFKSMDLGREVERLEKLFKSLDGA